MRHGVEILFLGVILTTLGLVGLVSIVWVNWVDPAHSATCLVSNYTILEEDSWINVIDLQTGRQYVFFRLTDAQDALEIYQYAYPLGTRGSCTTGDCDTCIYWANKAWTGELAITLTLLIFGLLMILLVFACREKNVLASEEISYPAGDSINYV